MKRIVMVISLSIIPAFLISAGHLVYAEDHSHGHSHQASEADGNGLSLNHGQRWQMDAHTRTMLIEMEKTFFAADHSSQAGLNAVGNSLKGQLDQLIVGCTMAGASHDQLHIFLSDYIPANDRLIQAGDYATARDAAIELKGHFETYKKYFR